MRNFAALWGGVRGRRKSFSHKDLQKRFFVLLGPFVGIADKACHTLTMNRDTRNIFTSFFFLCVVVFFAGCDRMNNKKKVAGLVPYEGVVICQGQPLDGVIINFRPKHGGRGAYARTDTAGHFKATTINPNDGIMKGQYSVNACKYVITGYTRAY